MTHSYPHSWRSKAPVIYRNTPQWFVAIDKPLDDGMDTYGRDHPRARADLDRPARPVVPAVSGRNRLFSMIEARPDWVLSRQRAWGVPLTCFVRRHPDGTAEILRDPAVNARIKEAFEHEGADAWFEENAKARFLANDHPHDDWEKVTDILDVWFDSGSTHAFALRDRPDGIWPAIVYLEGTDQHRGWFHSSMLQACGTRGRAPYDAVVTHGFTLDENGMKMSKSLGNTTAPAGRDQAVRRRHPAPLGGADRLHRRPAHRPGDPQGHRRQLPPPAQHPALPARRPRRLRRGRARRARRRCPSSSAGCCTAWPSSTTRCAKGYAAYDFQRVFQTLFQFATVDLSAFYFDIRKDALYCDAATSPRRRAARTVLDALFHRLVTWLAPMLALHHGGGLARPASPATTARCTSSTSPRPRATGTTPRLAAKWEAIRRVRRVVTGALEIERRDKRIGASLEAAPVVHVADAALRAALASVDFADVCITSDLTLSADPGPRRRLHPRRRPRRRRGPGARRGREVRPLLEDPARRRHPRPPRRLRPLRRGARLMPMPAARRPRRAGEAIQPARQRIEAAYRPAILGRGTRPRLPVNLPLRPRFC